MASVYCVFVFDTDILAGLPRDDRRVQLHPRQPGANSMSELRAMGGYLIVRHGRAARRLIPAPGGRAGRGSRVTSTTTTSRRRSRATPWSSSACATRRRSLQTFKDQVDLRKGRGADPGRRPFSRVHPLQERLAQAPGGASGCGWRRGFETAPHAGRAGAGAGRPRPAHAGRARLLRTGRPLPAPACPAPQRCWTPSCRASPLRTARDFPAARRHLAAVGAPALRHAVVRGLVRMLRARWRRRRRPGAPVWLSELIWREFYMMILRATRAW
jgi:deoxyribodipyrimidine photo-lyase